MVIHSRLSVSYNRHFPHPIQLRTKLKKIFMEKQSVFIKVDVKDELPKSDSDKPLIVYHQLTPSIIYEEKAYFKDGLFYYWEFEDSVELPNVISWLKELPSVYILSEEDMKQLKEDIAGKAFDAGYNHGWGQSEFEGESVTLTKKQYLQSLK